MDHRVLLSGRLGTVWRVAPADEAGFCRSPVSGDVGNRAGDRTGLPAGGALTGAAGRPDQRPPVATALRCGSERPGEEVAVRRVSSEIIGVMPSSFRML